MRNVAGKVAFITGGGSGMGLGMARAFTAHGMNVVIADVRQDHLDEALELLKPAGAHVHAIRLDVADRAAMAAAAEETLRRFGKVHVLVNNAAVGLLGPMIDARYDDWDWVLGVNIGGVVNGIIEFLPRIRAHGEPGHIVTTSSMAGLFAHGGGGAGIYNTTKYAVVGLMESLREELEPLGIGVSVFCPGLVNTNIHEFERLRPARYTNTGYAAHAEAAAAREQFMKTTHPSRGDGSARSRGTCVARDSQQRPVHPDPPGVRAGRPRSLRGDPRVVSTGRIAAPGARRSRDAGVAFAGIHPRTRSPARGPRSWQRDGSGVIGPPRASGHDGGSS